MKFRLPIYLFTLATLLSTFLLAACSADDPADESMPEGMGRLRITVCTPEQRSASRAVNTSTPWIAADHEWERLHSFRIIICDADGHVADIISGTSSQTTVTSDLLLAGTYTVYATANYADGITEGSAFNADATAKLTNGYRETDIPMSGKLAGTVTVAAGTTTNAGTVTVYRMMAKLEFLFTNTSTQKVRIGGIEVAPINQASATGPGIYLFSKDNLESTDNLAAGGITLPSGATEDVGPVACEPVSPATALLTLDEAGGTSPAGNLFFYVNETDASATSTQNQYSVRFKVQRAKVASPATEADWLDDEIRYGFTTNYTSGSASENGFNVIRRNDWIKIPVQLTGWQFQVEALPFPPIAGFQARMKTADAMSITFNSGGYIVLSPRFRHASDPEGVWSGLDDSRITLALPTALTDWETTNASTGYTGPTTSYAEYIAQSGTGAGTGIILTGGLDIFEQLFVKLPSGDIVGKLTNADITGSITVTLRVKLGGYTYQFHYNIIKE